MMTLEESIKREQMLADSNYEMAESCHTDEGVYLKEEGAYRDRAEYHEQLAEWLRELKWYREDTRFADLYERICIKRDEDRDYFARTKDQTYITRIAEKEMFIHMMQDMMFDRYGVEEVNADES